MRECRCQENTCGVSRWREGRVVKGREDKVGGGG